MKFTRARKTSRAAAGVRPWPRLSSPPAVVQAVPPTGVPRPGTAAGTTIVVGALPVIDTAGLQVALKEGFFTQAGLNVTVKSVTQSTAAIPDLLHGSIDVIGGGNYVSFLEAQAHGTFPVQILAPAVDCTPDAYGVVAMPSSGITTAPTWRARRSRST